MVTQKVRNLLTMQKTQVQSLSREDPLEEEMATHFIIFYLENFMDRGAWQILVHATAKSWTQLIEFHL